MAPASTPLPATVGVVTFVMLSLSDSPLSDALASSGASGPAAGVASIYGPGTNIPHAASEIMSLIRRRKKAA